MSCDCREFQELLLDLAYGELGEEDASRLRAHAASCPSCGQELDHVLVTRKLAAQLPAEAPAPSLAAAVLAEAREAARAGGQAAAIAEPGPGFFDRLRGALLRPAFATALAATVVFAISLYLYRTAAPERAPDAEAPSAPFFGPVGATAPAPEEGTAATLAAAEERERVAGRPEAAAFGRPAAAASEGAEPSLGTGLRAGGGGTGALGTAGPAPSEPADLLDGDGRAARREVASASGGGGEAPLAGAFDESAIGTGGGYGKAKKQAESAKSAGAGARSIFDEGMGAYDRGDCATATPLFAHVADDPNSPPGLVPRALHHLARCARRTGSCGRAVVYYERLLADWPSYPDRPDALWEAAACYRRLGQAQQALALLDQLERVPGWGGKARAERKSIELSAAAQ